MRKLTILTAMAAATALTSPAYAGNPEGHWQVKVLGTGVLADGEIDKVEFSALGLSADTQTKANDNVVPTIAAEYYFTPNISVETICCLTQHHVTATAGTLDLGEGGTAPMAGAELVDHVLILPATVTLKYHLTAGPIKPYIGVGPSLFLVFGEKPGSTATDLGITRVKLSNELGVAVQAGVDVPLNESGMGISLDAKKYFMSPTAHFYVDSAEVLTTKHNLDPWVLSGGVYFRF